MVKEAEVKLPVESEPRAEPELSIPEAPATGSDKSVSEMVPSASVHLEIPGETQAPVTEETPAPTMKAPRIREASLWVLNRNPIDT